MSTRILIVDDHPLFRKGVKDLLSDCSDFEVVGEASSGKEAITKLPVVRPDIVLMDIFMPNGDGIETTSLLRRQFPDTRVLLLSMSEDEQDFFRGLKAGASGYLLKNIGTDQLIRSLRMVSSGDAPFSPMMAARLLDQFRKSVNDNDGHNTNILSEREKEILQYAAEGSSNKEIAAKCFISETTVKAHFRNIMDKLDVRSRAGAVGKALEKGFLKY